ncbi:MAG: hypothetical protein D6805_09305 [Planctomycetota bacterium]|nr:MAG: hypothetical protein D6805_09305 [Planctomycetota bacterium]
MVGGTLFSKRVPLTDRKFLGSLKHFFLKRVSGRNVKGVFRGKGFPLNRKRFWEGVVGGTLFQKGFPLRIESFWEV